MQFAFASDPDTRAAAQTLVPELTQIVQFGLRFRKGAPVFRQELIDKRLPERIAEAHQRHAILGIDLEIDKELRRKISDERLASDIAWVSEQIPGDIRRIACLAGSWWNNPNRSVISQLTTLTPSVGVHEIPLRGGDPHYPMFGLSASVDGLAACGQRNIRQGFDHFLDYTERQIKLLRDQYRGQLAVVLSTHQIKAKIKGPEDPKPWDYATIYEMYYRLCLPFASMTHFFMGDKRDTTPLVDQPWLRLVRAEVGKNGNQG